MNHRVNRRDFLKAGSAALAALSFAAKASATPLGRRSIRKAIKYSALSREGADVDKLKAAKNAGFEGLEVPSNAFLAPLVATIGEAKLEVAGVSCVTYDNRQFADPDVEVRNDAFRGLWRAVKDAGYFGKTEVRLALGKIPKGSTYEQCFKWTADGVKDMIPVAKQEEVKIAFENSPDGFVTKPEQALALLKAVGSPLVGWHFNPAAAAKHGDPAAWVPALGKRLLNLTVTVPAPPPAKPKPGGAQPPTTPEVDWPAITKALVDIKFAGWAVCETSENQAVDVKSLTKLHDQIGKLLGL
jgi:hexulose-6-phosphate isomerase